MTEWPRPVYSGDFVAASLYLGDPAAAHKHQYLVPMGKPELNVNKELIPGCQLVVDVVQGTLYEVVFGPATLAVVLNGTGLINLSIRVAVRTSEGDSVLGITDNCAAQASGSQVVNALYTPALQAYYYAQTSEQVTFVAYGAGAMTATVIGSAAQVSLSASGRSGVFGVRGAGTFKNLQFQEYTT